MINKQLQTKLKIKKTQLKDIFKPSIFKLFFPIVILILILISFYINSTHIPSIGEHACSVSKEIDKEMQEMRDSYKGSILKVQTNNANPQNSIRLFKDLDKKEKNLRNKFGNTYEEFLINLKPAILGNRYLMFSKILNLNPFFPFPCELYDYSDINKDSCKYYMNEKDYNCIKDKILVGGILSTYGTSSYEKISFINLLFHSIILIAIVYLIISLVSFFNKILTEQSNKIKIIISIFLFIFVFLVSFMSRSNYTLFLLPFILCFIILSFVKEEHKRKLILSILMIFSIILLISGIFIIEYNLNKSFEHGAFNTGETIRYGAIPCENTKILTLEEKQKKDIEENYLNEEWNVCDNPSCSKICVDYCKEKYKQEELNPKNIMIRGDNPSCICGCFVKVSQSL